MSTPITSGASGGFTSPVNVSNTPGQSRLPAIAVGGSGELHVLWWQEPGASRDPKIINHASMQPGQAWSAPVEVSNYSFLEGSVHATPVVDSTGTVHATWYSDDPTCCDIYYSSQPPGGAWALPVDISNDAAISSQIARSLSIGPDDTLHAVWDDHSTRVLHAERPLGGTWSTPETVFDSGGNSTVHNAVIDVDPGGALHVAWAGGTTWYTNKLPGGSWASPVDISGSTLTANEKPSLAADSDGAVSVAWQGIADSSRDIFVATKPPLGTWGMPEQLTSTATQEWFPSLAVDNGVMHVVWQEGARDNPGASKLLYSSKAGANNWTTPIAVSQSATSFSGYAEIAARSGAVHVVWSEDESGDLEVVYSTLAANSPPVIESLTAPVDPVEVGTSISATSGFTDADVLDTHAAEWDWGDGFVTPGTVTEDNGSGAVADIHTYQSPGVYTPGLTVEDGAGATDTAVFKYVVVYDPSAGFATGGGWIIPGGNSSDPGDVLPGLDGSSKATFGFVVKYQSGSSTVPGGNLEFHYNEGSFHLNSTLMEWLVVTNSNWAHFQGTATIDGSADNYPFRVDARDDSDHGDRFIIKVWSPDSDPNNDEPVYKASGDLEGGQIKIHK